MKVAINDAFGGFRLTDEGEEYVYARAPQLFYGGTGDYLFAHDESSHEFRTNPAVIEAVELGYHTGDVVVIEVPDGIRIGIFDYDGAESVYEVGHAWGPQGELR
ncbi:hypothetical protein [Olsenella phocaeensis]|uniref:hypothetical protein n=1 Tax=Olsenella phocaeensis TaxID=1852385 RepID=UPI000931C62C|nr:hypothetical protein [Olsenella phocaeensis]